MGETSSMDLIMLPLSINTNMYTVHDNEYMYIPSELYVSIVVYGYCFLVDVYALLSSIN